MQFLPDECVFINVSFQAGALGLEWVLRRRCHPPPGQRPEVVVSVSNTPVKRAAGQLVLSVAQKGPPPPDTVQSTGWVSKWSHSKWVTEFSTRPGLTWKAGAAALSLSLS